MLRRDFLLSAIALAAVGCTEEPMLRVVSNTWPGYELLHGASHEGLIPPHQARLIRMPSATVVIQALVTGQADMGGLTLDEVLSARAAGLKLKVLAILDISMGADVVLARPGIQTSEQVRGKTICVEKSAVGAVMLDAFLKRLGLTTQDVSLLYATVDAHLEQYQKNKADIVVSFDPVASLLLKQGAIKLFDSSQIPGMIVDVLVVREEAIQTSPQAIRAVVKGYFDAMQLLPHSPSFQRVLSEGMGIGVELIPATYQYIELSDIAANHTWLNQGTLEQTADTLQKLMIQSSLLPRYTGLDGLGDAQFLPDLKL